MLGEVPKEACFLFKDVIKLKSNPSRATICKLGRKGKKVTEKKHRKGGRLSTRNGKKRKRGLRVVCKFVNKFCERSIGFIFNLKNRERAFYCMLRSLNTLSVALRYLKLNLKLSLWFSVN